MHPTGNVSCCSRIELGPGPAQEFEILVEFGDNLGCRAHAPFRRKVFLDHGNDQPRIPSPEQRPLRRLLLQAPEAQDRGRYRHGGRLAGSGDKSLHLDE
ncbi:hypothetical protein GCM10009856_01700 [Mycolicibacterium llatzerense]